MVRQARQARAYKAVRPRNGARKSRPGAKAARNGHGDEGIGLCQRCGGDDAGRSASRHEAAGPGRPSQLEEAIRLEVMREMSELGSPARSRTENK